MAFWIPAAISAGTSILGHVLNRKGGRPPKMQTTDVSGINNRMDELKDMDGALFQQLQQMGNANTGFASLANQRMGAASGNVGNFAARNQSMQMDAREQSQRGYLGAMENRNQQINQLLGLRTQVEMGNTDIRNQSAMNQFQARQNRTGDLLQGLLGAGMMAATGWQDQQRFGLQQTQNDNMQTFLSNMFQSQQGPRQGGAPSQSAINQAANWNFGGNQNQFNAMSQFTPNWMRRDE